jgi:hypothetical protein
MIEDRVAEFDHRMGAIYSRALNEADYNASRFLQMLEENGGVQTAHILLASPKVSDGYTALWERGRLDLTVEALVLEEDWGLFSEEQRRTARRRLEEYGYLSR